jgi:formiminoglutamase
MPVDVIPGSSALILAFARVGTHVPPHYYNRLTLEGQAMADTDWHLERCFDGLWREATVVRANFNRCLSDVNADPPDSAGRQAFPGGGVIPFDTLTGARMWERPPSPSEASSLKAAHYVPYHAALSAQIARVRARHGFAVLIDCGARPGAGPVPDWTAPGTDLWIDTHFGKTCNPVLAARVMALCNSEPAVGTAQNANRHCGWTIRAYGRPKSHVHCLQLTISKGSYLGGDADTVLYDPEKAAPLRALIRDVLKLLAAGKPN